MGFNSDSVQVFLAVLEHGSFSAAARSLGRVPSAVSMAIANLEADLDLVLFDRSGREPRPTEAALALAPQARQLAAHGAQLQAHALALTQGLESLLTLAIAPELLSSPWCAPLQTLAADYPQLEIEVLAAPQSDALAMLHSGRAQLALVFERPSLDGREGFQELDRETLLAVIAPGHPVMQSAGGLLREQHLTGTRQIVVAGSAHSDEDPRLVFARHRWHTNNPLAALGLITAGLGWGWLPQSAVQSHIAAGLLVEMRFENLSNGLQMCIDVVWSKERPLGMAARRFLECIGATRVTSAPA